MAFASDSTPAPISQPGPVTVAIRAVRADLPRRAILGAVIAAPLATVPEIAAPSDLALACAWATECDVLLDDPQSRAWSDEEWDLQYARCCAVYDRAAAEPSASLADIAAKARLALGKNEQHADDFDGLVDKIVLSVLREIIALGGATA